MLSRRSWMVLGMLSLCALLLRLAVNGLNHALLPDEGSSYFFAQLPLSALARTVCDPHPPGYYLLLKALSLGGSRESWLRLPSLVAGVLAVPLTWGVARLLLRDLASYTAPHAERAALWAAALVAVAPLAVWYSREARPYALLAALGLAMTWAGLRWRCRPTATAAGLYLLLGWAALGVEYGALVVCFALNLLVLSGWPWNPARARLSRRDWDWLALQVALLLPAVVWWLGSAQPAALRQMSYQAIFLAVQANAVGLLWTPATAQQVIQLLVLGVAASGGIAALALRGSVRVRSALITQPWAAWALLALALGLTVFGVWPRLYTIKRHLNGLLPFVLIAAAALITRWSRPRWLGPAVLGAMVALSLAASSVMLLTALTPPWRDLAALLRTQAAPADHIWVDELDAPVFAYYWGSTAGWQPLRARELAAGETPVSAVGLPEAQPSEQNVREIAASVPRIWLVGSVTPYRDLRLALPASFTADYGVSFQHPWPDAALTAYVRGADGAPSPAPLSQALRWGLAIQSPLDVVCAP